MVADVNLWLMKALRSNCEDDSPESMEEEMDSWCPGGQGVSSPPWLGIQEPSLPETCPEPIVKSRN